MFTCPSSSASWDDNVISLKASFWAGSLSSPPGTMFLCILFLGVTLPWRDGWFLSICYQLWLCWGAPPCWWQTQTCGSGLQSSRDTPGIQAFELPQSSQVLPVKTDSHIRTPCSAFHTLYLSTVPVPQLERLHLICPDFRCAEKGHLRRKLLQTFIAPKKNCCTHARSLHCLPM